MHVLPYALSASSMDRNILGVHAHPNFDKTTMRLGRGAVWNYILCLNGHMSKNVSFFSSCIKVYVFETRKAWNGRFCIKKNIWSWRKNTLIFKEITSNFVQFFQTTLQKHFSFFLRQNLHFLSGKGVCPPPLADMSAKNVIFFGPLP